MNKLLTFLLILFSGCLGATEHPFLTFSDAVLRVNKQKIYGQLDNGNYSSFDVLSYGPPQLAEKETFRKLNLRANSSRRSSMHINGDVLLIVDVHVGLVWHYFHFMEHLIGIWNFLASKDPDSIALILFAFQTPSEQDGERWKGAFHDSTRILLTSLFPHAKIGLLKDLPSNTFLKARNIHVSSRLRSHGIPEAGYNNMNGASRFDYDPKKLQKMRDRLFTALNIQMKPKGENLRIVYCKRTTGRIMDPQLEERFLAKVGQEPHCELKVVDFAAISFIEQLSTVANTDLFIGVHGNGLTHLFFLPDHATVLEYYEGGESAFFRLFAQLRGLRYFGNCGERWVTESYDSLENKPPFQENVTVLDMENTLKRIRECR